MKKIPALKILIEKLKTTITNLDTTLNDLLSGISIKMIQKAKLTIPHPFCKCGRLIKGRYCKIWGYYHK
jgi:hypothetical protein